jgi:hypothetical protein
MGPVPAAVRAEQLRQELQRLPAAHRDALFASADPVEVFVEVMDATPALPDHA